MIRLHEVTRVYASGETAVRALAGVSLEIGRGEFVAVMGQSGSGKSMTAWSILGLVPKPAGRIIGGSILYQGENLLDKSDREMQQIRGSGICMVMQDPLTSLNPVLNIGNQILECLRMNQGNSASSLREQAAGLLARVRIPAPETRLAAFPHQMSGGMRQRVVGAIAVSRSPNLLIADEPTTSLDATIQLQYLNMLKEIQAQTGAAIIFITHDFGIVARMCDRVAVMYAGKIVEQSEVVELFDNPAHPYTEALLQSVPDLDTDVDLLPSIEGQPPSLDNLPEGCSFAPRCPYVFDKCSEYPPEFPIGPGQVARCWRYHDTA